MTKRQIRAWLKKRENHGAAAEFARTLGVSRSLISMWMNGDRNNATLDAEIPKLIAKWRKE